MANTPTTDLTDLYTDGVTNWAELASYGAGATPSLETEAFLQGLNCVSQQIASNKTGAASGMDYSATDPTGFVDGTDVFFFWWLFLFPSALNPYNETVGQTAPGTNSPGTASGFFIGIGSSTTNHDWYAVGGSDFGRYPYGGWQNVAIDPGQSASWTDGPPAASTYTNFGFLPNVSSAPSRGQSLVADAIRWGRGLIQYTGGSPAGTFEDIATTNDTTTNRWGLFQKAGGSYLFKGKLELGTTASSLLFSDTNKTINIDDTRQVYTGFNVIEINNAASDITLQNITITKLKYIDSLAFDNSKGNFLVNDGATLDMDGCTFSDMNTFTFGSGCDVATTAFLRCSTVTQSGAIINACDFINSTAASSLVANNLSNITGACTFESDGSNHAIEFTGTVPSSYTWNHTTTGYAAGSLGVEGTDFTAGSTGNETFYINPSSADSTAITITVPSGITTPSIRRGANYTGTITVQVQAKTIDVNVKDENGTNVSGAFVWLNDGAITIFNGTTDANGNIPQQSYSGSNNTTLRVRKYGYEPFETTLGTATGNASSLVTLLDDAQQQVAAPTLTNTWTINTTLSTITMTSGPTLPYANLAAIDESVDLYRFVQNTFAATAFMDKVVPLEAITRRQFNFINGYTFGAKDNDHKFLYGGSFTDAANSLLWSNVKTIGSLNAGGIYVVQGVEASDSKLTTWWPDGNIDILVKVQDGTFIQSTDESATAVDGAIWLFSRDYGSTYDHFFTDLSAGGQSIVALSTLSDPNNQTASGTVAAYGVTISSFGTISRSLDSTNFYNYRVEINGNGKTLAEVYEYLKYATSEDFSITIDGDDGFEYRNADEALTTFTATDVKQAPFGTFAGGTFFGAQGVFLTNVVGTTFELIDNTGATRTPPVTTDFQITGLKDGTEVRIYNSNTLAEIAGVEDMTGGVGTSTNASVGQVFISGSTDNNTFRFNYNFANDFSSTPVPIFVIIMNLGYLHIRLDTLPDLTVSGQSIPVTQTIDRNYNDPD